MTETPLSEQDELDLALLNAAPEPSSRSLLTVWNEILGNAETNRDTPVSVGVAFKVVSSWPFLKFQDTAQYHIQYHDQLIEVRAILRDHIAAHEGCTDFHGDDDATENHVIYRDVLVDWQLLLSDKESEWSAEDDDAHITVAVIADVRAFIFSPTGLVGHLDAIGFTMEDEEFLEALAAATEERGE